MMNIRPKTNLRECLAKSLFPLVIATLLLLSPHRTDGAGAETFIITRLNNAQPIITEAMFDALGATYHERYNINGPSVIRVPDWIPPANRADPNAVYYMYFAHHAGNYIRMAWATEIEGPWHLYHIGSGVNVGERGVLDLGGDDRIYLDNGITIYNHVASPDVFVDDENQRIIMYFHGPTQVDGGSTSQKALVATSLYGLDFSDGIEPVRLGRFYFRVFKYKGSLYATSNKGFLFKAPDPNDPWTPPPGFDFRNDLWTVRPDSPFQNDINDADFSGVPDQPLRVRHSAVRLVADTMQVFYSRIGDCPERLMLSTIDLSVGDYDVWDPTFPPRQILQAELDWEGGNIPPKNSQGSAAPENVNELRDPCIFADNDGSLYLFYCGKGEDAIGIARLQPIPLGHLDFDEDVDFVDYAHFAARWRDTGCGTCGAADLTGDAKVQFDDLRDFVASWLICTE